MKQILLLAAASALALLSWYSYETPPHTLVSLGPELEMDKAPSSPEKIVEAIPKPIAQSFTALLPLAEHIPESKKIPKSEIYARGLKSTLNLICEIAPQEYVVATGVVIDARGYALSNAHITEHLTKPRTSCKARNGSPATDIGPATLVFIPNSYTTATSETEKAQYDISLWKIAANSPDTAWEIDFSSPTHTGETLLTQSYPAELLGGEIILNSLHLVFSETVVSTSDHYFIQSRLGLGAQRGSSGGILIDPNTAKIKGLIFAVSEEKEISQRRLFSLTPYAINEAIKKETGKDLSEFIATR